MAGDSLGSQVVSALDRLMSRPRSRKSLSTIDPRGGVAAKRGVAPWVESRPNNSAGGVAWPLTEQNYAQREYHPQGEFTSDGLFYLPAIKKIVLTDADGTVGEVLLAAPPAPEES